MIDSTDALVAHTETKLANIPVDLQEELAGEVLISRPGMSERESAVVAQSLPGFPSGCLGVLQEVNLNGVAIGGCQFYSSALGMAEALLSYNIKSVDPALSKLAQRHGLYMLGSFMEEPMGVLCAGGSLPEGSIAFFRHDEPGSGSLRRLAAGLKELLFLAANAEEVWESRGKKATQEIDDEFCGILSALGMEEATHRFVCELFLH